MLNSFTFMADRGQEQVDAWTLRVDTMLGLV
jgi:hypothetical protein